jgi:hypothetical protein
LPILKLLPSSNDRLVEATEGFFARIEFCKLEEIRRGLMTQFAER